MKNWALWGVSILVGFSAPAMAIPSSGSANTACMRMILERPMVEAMAAKLKPECRELRSTYLKSLQLFSRNSAEFQKEIASGISSDLADPSYRAIVMAAIFEETSLLPALESRAAKEQAKKSRLTYATAAVERLKTGRCTSRFQSAPYDEICRLASPAARRLRELNQTK